ncbi:Fucose 4-O-acetylase and related acetyltransferases [Fusobacterium necrogenes]|uniref:Fucose 4-O-acetylase and related acetyltransferases n=1 Tax=Fusobacterium necrogenes TaxID=858 RepID=A0A377GV17_9FUSO|nr:acyltransferase family protein [Fusobacterium necrogenes]STO30825.1 Fucose 4-O-acetylase and related acetyltransferases [Fusobacterium necrogenes]
MENKKISFLQIFGIILVVLGHAENTNGIVSNLHRWIYSFHMPLFIFISGYLLKFTTEGRIGDIQLNTFVIKKIKRLIIPYFLISSLAYVPKYLLGKFALRPLELSIKDYILNMLYPWDNPIIFFWFLPTIFLIMLLTIVLYRVLKNKTKIILLLSLIINIVSSKFLDIRFLNINGVLNYLIFFILGVYYLENENKFDEILKRNTFVFIITFTILIINAVIILPVIKIYNIFIAGIGIIFSLSCSRIYLNSDYSFLEHLKGKSFSIYLFSWFPQVFVRILGYQILNLSMIIVMPISLIMGIYIPVLINLYIKNVIQKYSKVKFLKYIFGL